MYKENFLDRRPSIIATNKRKLHFPILSSTVPFLKRKTTMKTFLFILSWFITTSTVFCAKGQTESDPDSQVRAELDLVWQQLSESVKEGDFAKYSNFYHPDAVVVFEEQNSIVPINQALASWKKGFEDTKSGAQIDKVEFRFSKRIANSTTAHESGIFHFTSHEKNGKLKFSYLAHFEMVLVKKEGRWLVTVENQKKVASQAEWEEM